MKNLLNRLTFSPKAEDTIALRQFIKDFRSELILQDKNTVNAFQPLNADVKEKQVKTDVKLDIFDIIFPCESVH